MTFYEQELRKNVGASFPQSTYVGRACYIPLGEQLRAKVQAHLSIFQEQQSNAPSQQLQQPI